MARIAGVATKKNVKGDVTHVTIDLRRHTGAVPLLKELGLMEKSQFEKECETGETLENLRDFMYQKIDEKTWPQ